MDPRQPPAAMSAAQRATLIALRARHWRRTRVLSGWLLALWLLTTFGSAFYARELAALTVFGWPLSFYLAAQGAALVYLAIVGLYAWRMRRLDRDFADSARDAP